MINMDYAEDNAAPADAPATVDESKTAGTKRPAEDIVITAGDEPPAKKQLAEEVSDPHLILTSSSPKSHPIRSQAETAPVAGGDDAAAAAEVKEEPAAKKKPAETPFEASVRRAFDFLDRGKVMRTQPPRGYLTGDYTRTQSLLVVSRSLLRDCL